MKIENYWSDLDIKLEKLADEGFVKLPSLNGFNLDNIASKISYEMGSLTFKEMSLSHRDFLNYMEIDKYLVPKLLNLAKKLYGFKGAASDQYHIARKVEPGNYKEQYRAHFDSHLFTMVLPIKIPKTDENETNGELIYFSKIRKMPSNELSNFLSKLFFKKYASKKGIETLSNKKKNKIDNFIDYKPLLFLGKTTLHTNYPVSIACSSYRLTLLAHFFDDSPKYGVGNMLRLLRRR